MIKSKAQIKDTWNKIGKKYGGYRRKPWKEIKDFIENVDDDLLDIGCGSCANTKVVLDKGIKLYGVDFSKEILKHVPEKVIKIEADCTKIPLKRKFKYIISIGMLHHLPTEKDRINCLKEIKRLLAKDGEAFITVWYSKDKGSRLVKWGVDYDRFYHFFSKKELEDLLKKSDINNFELSKISGAVKLNNFKSKKSINYLITLKG